MFVHSRVSRFSSVLTGLLGVLLTLLVAPRPMLAQDAVWVGGGPGFGGVEDNDRGARSGPVEAGALFLSMRSGPQVMTARVAANGEPFGDSVQDVGLLYGSALGSDGNYFSFGLGLSVVRGHLEEDGFSLCLFTEDCDEERRSFTTLGLPAEVQVFWHSKYVGLGLYGFANLNAQHSFAGATLSLLVGRFR